MSGTSLDGVDAAIVDIEGRKICSVAFHSTPYREAVRRAIIGVSNTIITTAEIARLHVRLGQLYTDAVHETCRRHRVPPSSIELVGCHGQTIYHQGDPRPFLGQSVAATLQIGEAGMIAEALGVPVVSDFRMRDMAAGGKGAPLVPYLDYLLYRDDGRGRIALNIGGIANVTAIPAGATPDDLIAFDTGPGNMVIDAMTQKLFRKPYDRDGRIAAAGRVLEGPVSQFLRLSFFRRKPPKTAGREEFGHEFAEKFWRHTRTAAVKAGKRGGARVEKADVIRTATVLTTRSISDAVRRYVLPQGSFSELIASGGGAKNPILMASLANEAGALGLR